MSELHARILAALASTPQAALVKHSQNSAPGFRGRGQLINTAHALEGKLLAAYTLRALQRDGYITHSFSVEGKAYYVITAKGRSRV